jgi:wobble nucleotide-excising tRNase
LSHLLKIAKPPTQPAESINQLKEDAEIFQKDEGTKCTELPVINISINDIESNKLFQKGIVGDENSAISELIKKLNNSDWIKKGLDYIPKQ